MFQELADRFGVSVYVLYGALALVVVGLVLWLRRVMPQAPAMDTSSANTTGVVNGPWSTGAQTISTQPNGTSPQGGADSINPATTGTQTTTSGTPATASAIYVHPAPWPAKTSTLSGIASYYQVPLASIEGFAENQYIKNRSSWNLIYTTDAVRIR